MVTQDNAIVLVICQKEVFCSVIASLLFRIKRSASSIPSRKPQAVLEMSLYETQKGTHVLHNSHASITQ